MTVGILRGSQEVITFTEIKAFYKKKEFLEIKIMMDEIKKKIWTDGLKSRIGMNEDQISEQEDCVRAVSHIQWIKAKKMMRIR